jgi:hypothetical protein
VDLSELTHIQVVEAPNKKNVSKRKKERKEGRKESRKSCALLSQEASSSSSHAILAHCLFFSSYQLLHNFAMEKL